MWRKACLFLAGFRVKAWWQVLGLPWNPLASPQTSDSVVDPQIFYAFLSSTEILPPDIFPWVTSVLSIRSELYDTEPVLLHSDYCCPYLLTQTPFVILCYCYSCVSPYQHLKLSDLFSWFCFLFISIWILPDKGHCSFTTGYLVLEIFNTWHFERNQLIVC